MKSLRFTLQAEGPSDDMLIPVVRWVLQQQLSDDVPINPQFAEWFNVRPRPKGLTEKVRASLRLFPCDLLIIHRDADNESHEKRVAEINEAVAELVAEGDTPLPPHVCVVPVRMSEAWLLYDEDAIRQAAGNPNGRAKLSLPSLKTVEGHPDPKAALRAALATASELSGRRLKKFEDMGLAREVASYIEDFSRLRRLPAFQAFEAEIQQFTESWSPEE